ncbi:MAG: Ig-like domain-containing protein, partial [Allobaculum sp.]|nr:Ig-like domain-containing protein [Allobaculum sp.]
VSDNTKVSLTESGNIATVTGLQLGETTITVRAKDGSNVSASATIKVVAVPASSITLAGTSTTTLKERETNQLTATVSPENTTYPDVEWSSSDTKVATVDQNGLVTAIAKGNAVITAKVIKTPNVTAQYSLTVEALLLGDSNDDKEVDVFDVVNIANYIVGKNPTPFCFVASDVIWDKTINVADQSATVNLALGLPVEQPSKVPSRYMNANTGRLIVGELRATSEGKVVVPVSISSDIKYSSLQADMMIPEGMEIVSVRTTPKASNHSLMYNVTDEGVLKVVMYSMENSALPSFEDNVLELVIDANGKTGILDIDNIFASTPDCSLFNLEFEGCEISNPSSVDGLLR